MTTLTPQPPQQAHGPACTCCGKTRKLRKGSAVSYEGAQGLCRACHTAAHKKAAVDPYKGKRWYELASEAAPRARLESRAEGYRPSFGTAGMGQVAA